MHDLTGIIKQYVHIKYLYFDCNKTIHALKKCDKTIFQKKIKIKIHTKAFLILNKIIYIYIKLLKS